MRGQPMGSLAPEQLALLEEVVEDVRRSLKHLLSKEDDLSRAEAEELVNAIGERVGLLADDDPWEPDSYGSKLEELLDVINRHRMP